MRCRATVRRCSVRYGLLLLTGTARQVAAGATAAAALAASGCARQPVASTPATSPARLRSASDAPSRAPAAAPLVLRGVTVVDVEHGRHIADQTVVVVGNRIRAMGPAAKVQMPRGAQVIDGRGKYLIPGLWDLHTHAMRATELFYPFFIANGVTGIRDAGSPVPLDTLRQWRQDILRGARVGPPRQILSGPSLQEDPTEPCSIDRVWGATPLICVAGPADVRHIVDSLKAAGADMIKVHVLSAATYLAAAAEARRMQIPLGGHLGDSVSALGASNSRVTIIDHLGLTGAGGLDTLCGGRTASIAQCGLLAERFRRNGTWVVPTLDNYPHMQGSTSRRILQHFKKVAAAFWAGSLPSGNWLRDTAGVLIADSIGSLTVARRVGLPILAGTDVAFYDSDEPPGFALPVELAILVAEGLSPLEALQSATLNPAKMLHATDSLGTVAAGRLADLVLLDADPLADITNTTTIRAVVANGRYYDRAALDQLLTEAHTKLDRLRTELDRLRTEARSKGR